MTAETDSTAPQAPARERAVSSSMQPGAGASPDPATPPVRPGRKLVVLVTAFVLVVATAGYLVTGSPQAVGEAARAPAGDGNVTPEQVQEMVTRLEQRLRDQPDDATGWAMLGRTYMVLEQPAKAQAAFERVRALRPQDATALADLADAVATVQGRVLAGEPAQLVEAALKLDPDHVKALALAGTAAFERQDYATAVRHWERIVALEPADSPIGAQARAGADEARRLGRAGAAAASRPESSSAPPRAAAGISAPAGPAAASAAAVAGTVVLAPALRGKVRPDDTVFIFARPAQGGRMPLAIVRRPAEGSRFEFTLDDSMAMSPDMTLSKFGEVIVGARVSKSGSPMPQKGDLEGLSKPVKVGRGDVALTIDTELR